MISLEDFTTIVQNINTYMDVSDRLYHEFRIDLGDITEPLSMALERTLRCLIPEDRLDYFMDSVYGVGVYDEESIKGLYENIFIEEWED